MLPTQDMNTILKGQKKKSVKQNVITIEISIYN